jgi:hypothetical protein
MPLDSYRSRRSRQRRRKFWLGLLITIAVLGGLFGIGYQAHETGSQFARRDVERLEKELAGTKSNIDDLKRENTEMIAELADARQREQQWRSKYDTDVPKPPLSDLLIQLDKKLKQNIDPARLSFVIDAAENRRECDEEPETKRFLVRTPLYQGANDSVTFASSQLTVLASGASAVNDSGNIEAWFDPAKPVTVQFTSLGGKTTQTTGMLPLHHSIVLNDSEYRFSVTLGQRGFATVTGAHCAYP